MNRPPVSAALRAEIKKVASRLESSRLSMPERLALLRRQAQLGDERDAALDRARRASLDR